MPPVTRPDPDAPIGLTPDLPPTFAFAPERPAEPTERGIPLQENVYGFAPLPDFSPPQRPDDQPIPLAGSQPNPDAWQPTTGYDLADFAEAVDYLAEASEKLEEAADKLGVDKGERTTPTADLPAANQADGDGPDVPGMAAGLTGLTGGVMAAVGAVQQFAAFVRDGAAAQQKMNFALAEASGAMAAVKLSSEMGDFFRDMEVGNRLSGSARELSGADQSFKDQMKEFEVLGGQVKNLLFATGLEVMAQVLKPFAELIQPINSAIEELVGSGEVKGDIWDTVQRAEREADAAKRRANGWWDRNGGKPFGG